MLKGGLIPNRIYLVKGGPGAGKTIFSIQFLYTGVKNGENVIYVTLEEPTEEIKENMKLLGMNLDEYPNFHIIDASPTGKLAIFGDLFFREFSPDLQGLRTALEQVLGQIKPSRVVIDPITMLELAAEKEIEYRRNLLIFFQMLKKFNVTVILTTERTKESAEDFLVSGIIELLNYEIQGKTIRGIRIRKIRGSDFDEQIRPYRITSQGIEVYSEERLFT